MWPTWSVTIILSLSHLDLYLEVYTTTFQAGVSLCWQTTVLGREPALIFVSTKTKENAWILAITNSRNMGFLSATCSSSPAYRILQSIRYLSWCSCTPQLQDVPMRLSPDSMHSTLPHSRPKYAWVIFYSTFLSSSTGLVSYSCLESQSCSGFFRFFWRFIVRLFVLYWLSLLVRPVGWRVSELVWSTCSMPWGELLYGHISREENFSPFLALEGGERLVP